jgi:hypothetical protein
MVGNVTEVHTLPLRDRCNCSLDLMASSDGSELVRKGQSVLRPGWAALHGLYDTCHTLCSSTLLDRFYATLRVTYLAATESNGDEINSANNTLEGSLWPKLTDLKFEAVTEGTERRIPNRDWCLLVIWSFVAGFSENFVPTILVKTEEKGQAGKAGVT